MDAGAEAAVDAEADADVAEVEAHADAEGEARADAEAPFDDRFPTTDDPCLMVLHEIRPLLVSFL